MSSTRMDIEVFRNASRVMTVFCVDALGNPIDITSTTIASSAKAQAGDASVIASATIVKDDPVNGIFTYTWDGSDFSSYGNVMAECYASFDIKVDSTNLVHGQLIIKPGVTS